MPKPELIAKTAARAIADFVNNSSKQEAIAAFIEKTKDLQDAQFLVTKWLSDGKIDNDEQIELEKKLASVSEIIYNKVLEKVS